MTDFGTKMQFAPQTRQVGPPPRCPRRRGRCPRRRDRRRSPQSLPNGECGTAPTSGVGLLLGPASPARCKSTHIAARRGGAAGAIHESCCCLRATCSLWGSQSSAPGSSINVQCWETPQMARSAHVGVRIGSWHGGFAGVAAGDLWLSIECMS